MYGSKWMQINMVWTKCFIHLFSNTKNTLGVKCSAEAVDVKDKNIWSCFPEACTARAKADQLVIKMPHA